MAVSTDVCSEAWLLPQVPSRGVIPAQAAIQYSVIPAKAGIQGFRTLWIPACAGMTDINESPFG
jgi:hypothetical protein